MKLSLSPHVSLAIGLSFAALLLLPAQAAAEDAPPPEAPAAPLPPAAEVAPPPDVDQPTPSGADEPHPLAAQDLQPYLGGDPWFKVGSVIHRYMTDCTGQPLPCTQFATPISAALNDIAGGLVPSDRYLYIDYSAVPFPDEDDVHVDGDHPKLALLKGIRGILDEGSGTFPLLHGNILIESMPNGFTLSGIQVAADDSPDSSVHFFNNDGTIVLQDVTILNTHPASERGLYIWDHEGNLELTRVKVNGNPGNGAEIDTDNQTGVVKILASTFDDNGGYGLWLNTDLTVTVDSISASRNSMYGMKINRDNPAKYPHNVSIANSIFSGNVGAPDDFSVSLSTYGVVKLENVLVKDNVSTGLRIQNQGDVIIRSSMVVNNQGIGISMDTCGSETAPCPYLSTGKVTLQGVNTSGNSDYGLSVSAKDALTVIDLLSLGSAVRLHNHNGSGNVSLTGVRVEGALQHDGVEIHSRGSVTLKNLTVTGSINGAGLMVDNRGGTGNVTLSASSGFINRFDQNQVVGISINSGGNISLTALSANRNGGTTGGGVVLTNSAGGIKRKITVSRGEFCANKGDGLFIASLGSVYIKDTSALDNTSSGVDAWLDGDGVQVGDMVAGKPTSITLTNLGANRNASNGLNITSLGKVTLSASSRLFNELHTNSLNGATIHAGGPISLKSLRATENANGIHLETIAQIVVTNIFADSNDEAGLVIQTSMTTGKVTVRQVSARDNGQEGLRVESGAAVLLDRIIVQSNGLSGGSEGYSGIYVTAPAQIVTLKSSQAMGNGKHGVHVVNALSSFIQSKNMLLGNNANGGLLDLDRLHE